MNFVEIIARKRDGFELDAAEIAAFVRGATDGSIGDEQLAAMLMAICIRGASPAETQHLVESMRDSGARWRVGDEAPEAVDKHSTGGVGDTVSLVFAPLVAACGVPVMMMAGAGLGHTQGTLDKLAAIPGFRTAAGRDEALARLRACGVSFAAQSREIAPADKKLYLLRDVTGTVPSLPLIVASIMSKKLAVGAARLVLDVKCGPGAFCKTPVAADALARALVDVARRAGVEVRALITAMDQPLGHRLGCACEVRAALEVLRGRGDPRLRELTLELAVDALALAGRPRPAARVELERRLGDGSALARYRSMVSAHGGDPDESKLATPRQSIPALAPRGGFVEAVAAEELGWIAVALGAGRRWQGDAVDAAAGLEVLARVGDRVEAGAPLATLELGHREVEAGTLAARAAAAFVIGDEPPSRMPLVLARVGEPG
ncbi:MAG TPA: thymidine phosphorylase [Thermoanaerobaculaceae bacterium]|nr:thymidine phosphorylase [Thermoanaerobaculaceae bacterium]